MEKSVSPFVPGCWICPAWCTRSKKLLISSHQPSQQALVDIKGRSENLSLAVNYNGKFATTETPTAVLSPFRAQMYHLYIWWDTFKCREQLIVSTCCLVGTLSPRWRMSRRFVNDAWKQMSPPPPQRLTGKRSIFCHSSQQKVQITRKNTFLLENRTDDLKPEIKKTPLCVTWWQEPNSGNRGRRQSSDYPTCEELWAGWWVVMPNALETEVGR